MSNYSEENLIRYSIFFFHTDNMPYSLTFFLHIQYSLHFKGDIIDSIYHFQPHPRFCLKLVVYAVELNMATKVKLIASTDSLALFGRHLEHIATSFTI